jgi:signal peptidase
MTGALRSLLPAAIAFFALIGVLPLTGLYRAVTPLSGSMEPMFAPGDLVVMRPEPLSQVRVGQVITYSIPIGDRHLETHRVIKVLSNGDNPIVQTKGDANSVADPWTAVLKGSPVWTVHTVIPKVGWVLLFFAKPWLRVGFLLAVAAFFLAIGLVRIWAPAMRTPAPVAELPAQRGERDDAAVAA